MLDASGGVTICGDMLVEASVFLLVSVPMPNSDPAVKGEYAASMEEEEEVVQSVAVPVDAYSVPSPVQTLSLHLTYILTAVLA